MAGWLDVDGPLAIRRPRIRGPLHQQRAVNPDGTWSVVIWEQRAGAWYEEAARPGDQVGSVIGADRYPPDGVKVSRPGSAMRQVALSYRSDRGRALADPEGYSR